MMEAAGQHNVDADEIAKFSQIADKWWDKNGEFKPLHDINPLRLGYIDSFAQLAGKRVLDVGCGGGILSESMANAAQRTLPASIWRKNRCKPPKPMPLPKEWTT